MKSPLTNSHLYCHLIGKLIFLTITRLDIAYDVSRLSNYMTQPQEAHLKATKHVLRYLQGTTDQGILYHADVPVVINDYTNVDWGSCIETRRYIGANVFTLVRRPITWKSKCQLTISRYSTESEYCALSNGTLEAVWLRQLLQELQPPDHIAPPTSITTWPPNQPIYSIILNCNNQRAIKISQNSVFHARTKHIEIHYHFICERVLVGEIRLRYIHTNS